MVLTLGLELRELLLGQNRLRLFRVLGFARFVTTGLHMLSHRCVHLRLLLRREIETGQ